MRENWLDQKCPCESGVNYSQCCESFIVGEKDPQTAVELMRSRYTAFVVAEPEYVFNTHDPETRHQVTLKDISKWSEESDGEGLEILSSEKGQEGDDKGVVEFIASYSVDGKKSRHHERSNFNFKDGKWFFTDGHIIHETFKRAQPKVGRNELCLCGSGKKFKKCCGR